jgi:hypothetical protein
MEWNGMEWNGIEWNEMESNVIIIFKYYNYVRLFIVLYYNTRTETKNDK